MPRKCIVFGCRSGYRDDKERISIYRFPSDTEQCSLWIRSLPNAGLKLEDISKNMGVCAKHWDWTSDVPMKTYHGGKKAPLIPPNNFVSPEIPSSSVPTPTPKPRTSKRSLSVVRSLLPDEIGQFNSINTMTISNFHNELDTRLEMNSTVGYFGWSPDEQSFAVFSKLRKGSIHKFNIYFTIEAVTDSKITEISYEAFHELQKIKHPLFSKISSWDQFDVLLHHMSNFEETSDSKQNKFDFLKETNRNS